MRAVGHGPLPDQPAGREDPDPVADRLDLVEQVAREQDGHVPLRDQLAQQVEDLGHAERVDRGRRLVEDEDVRILDQRIGDPESLEHASRVFLGVVVGPVGQTHLLERLVDRVLGLGARDPVEPGRVAQVVATGHVGVEANGVREVADAPLHLERPAGRIEPDDAGLALGRLGQPEQHQDGRRLAGAVLAEEAEVVDGDEIAVHLGQAAGPDRRPRPVVTLGAGTLRGGRWVGARGGTRPAELLAARPGGRRGHRRP